MWVGVRGLAWLLRLGHGAATLLASIPALFFGLYFGLSWATGSHPLAAISDADPHLGAFCLISAVVVGPIISLIGIFE